jgi:hypothetical protein
VAKKDIKAMQKEKDPVLYQVTCIIDENDVRKRAFG